MLMLTTLKKIKSFVFSKILPHQGICYNNKVTNKFTIQKGMYKPKKIIKNRSKFKLPKKVKKVITNIIIVIVTLLNFLKPFVKKTNKLTYVISKVLFQTNDNNNEYFI